MTDVTVASYNVQYGKGLDGKINTDRIAGAVADADIICFQEITTGLILNGGLDMVAELKARFADRFCAYHAPCDIDMGSHVDGRGRAVSSRMQFGNMVVSRWPFKSVRGHLLPRRHRTQVLNLQRGLLETVIETPLGTHVFSSVHLDHISGAERLEQVAALKLLLNGALRDGASISGTRDFGLPEPALPQGFLVAGDFNMEPSSAEYAAMTGEGVVDVTVGDDGWTWTDPAGNKLPERLDYVFCDPGMAAMATGLHINRQADGSDHMPVFVTFSA